MTTAFVLISCVLGKEGEIIENLKQMDSVMETSETFGAYDVIATIENNGKDRIQDIVDQNIQNMNDVRSTLTLVGRKEF